MYNCSTIACVVLNYNDALQTREFVQSISQYNTIDSIIIVDNCSTDNSADVLKQITDRKIHLFVTERNGGYGFGNNFGVSIAKSIFCSDYVLICNPDVRFEEKLIKSVISAFSLSGKIALVSALQINGYNGEKIKNYAWSIPTYWGYLRSSLIILNRICSKRMNKNNKRIERVDCVPGAFLAIDVNKFIESGGYDERIFLFCEESTLGFRLKKHGYYSVVLKNISYYHYHSTSIKKSIPKEMIRHKMVLSSRMFYIKNYLHSSVFGIILAKIVFGISAFEYGLLCRYNKRK